MKKKLLLMGSTTIVFFIVAEIIIRFFYAVPPVWHEPQIPHLESPLLGWVMPPFTEAYTIDAPVSTNSLGLRDDEFPLDKPDGEIRILCLGDSFTLALGVLFEDLYVQKLERLLGERHPEHEFQVINAGVGGYGTRQELIYLLSEGLTLKPDLIIIGFYWNDILRNNQPLPDIATTPKVVPGHYIQWGQPIHTLPAWLRNLLRKSVLLYQTVISTKAVLQLVRPSENQYHKYHKALLNSDESLLDPLWETTKKYLLLIERTASQSGIPVTLMMFPMEDQIRYDFPKLIVAERLRGIWETTGEPFVDLTEEYRESFENGDNPFLPYDRHPNKIGMEIAALSLYMNIIEHDLLNLQTLARSEVPSSLAE